MVRRHLHGRDVLVRAQESDLLRGRDVQHVDARAGLPRDRARGAASHASATSGERQTGCERGSPSTRRPLRSRSIVSSSEWKAARRRVRRRISAMPASSSTSSEPVEEPMKTLMPAAAGRRSSVGDLGRVLVRAADPEREVAMHAVACPRRPCRRGRLARRLRLGVRHLEDRRDAAHDGGAGAAFEVFLVVEAGLAEMHLRVDHARQDVQAAAIDDPLRRGAREIADGGDARRRRRRRRARRGRPG